MNSELVVVGLNHRSAAAELRERLAVLPPARVFARLRELGVSEAVLLSTCNRYELYMIGIDSEAVPAALAELSGARLEDALYTRAGAQAAQHLFEVAAGLDSLVVGETEILGQVRAAYAAARDAGITGKQLNVLFQRALFVGKKVRSETAIAVGQSSVAAVAVQLAGSIFGELAGSTVLVLGAGAMAESTAKHFLSRKVGRLTIANRTHERGVELAARLKARAVPFGELGAQLERVDIVVCSTASPEPVVTRALVEKALRARSGRSLFLIDIAMPRDVEDAVHGLEHVYVYRLEDLEAIVTVNMKTRGAEIERARELVRGKAAEFGVWRESVAAGREISLKHA